MTAYFLLKFMHIAFVSISALLFTYRFALLNLYPHRSLPKTLRVVPHVNDTLLLASAIGMLVLVELNPIRAPWLLAKFAALLVYIGLGAVCMHAKPRSLQQSASFVAAVAVLLYIVAVALSKRVLPL